MYILNVGYMNGAVVQYGPFPSEKRALEYGETLLKAEPERRGRMFVKPLIVPYSVVKNVVWR